MVFAGVLARRQHRAKCLTRPSRKRVYPPSGCITSQGLRHCLDARICLISQFGTRPGRMSPKTIDLSSLRPYAHLPTSRTSSRGICIALPCRLARVTRCIRFPLLHHRRHSEPRPTKPCSITTSWLAIASDSGLRSLQMRGLEPAARRGSQTSESGKGPIETAACYVVL